MLTRPIVQVAYFVSDVRAAARQMHRRFGAGPFFVADRIDLAWGSHRGEPREFLHSSAYGQWGNLMLELVQQDEEGPSPFRDLFAPGEEGLHHVAQIVDSLEDSYRFCVTDDGPGIPEKYQQRIFRMFETLKRRDEVEASGVGLAIVDRLVQSLGGSIEVQSSASERGTTFVVTLPADAAGERAS